MECKGSSSSTGYGWLDFLLLVYVAWTVHTTGQRIERVEAKLTAVQALALRPATPQMKAR